MSIIFCSQDVERVLGLEQILPDISVICINRNALSDHLQKKVKNFFCLEDYEPVKDAISTFDLLNHPLAQKFIKKISGTKKPEILVFKNIPKVEKLAKKQGWKLLNNSANFNQIFEDKINFIKECQLAGIQIPTSLNTHLAKTSYSKLKEKLGSKFVVQFRRGHAGETTHFINSADDWKQLLLKKGDFPARISSFIAGKTFTYNLCIAAQQNVYSNLMYQITGQKPYTIHAGGTCGVDMAYAKQFRKHEKNMQKVINKFADLLRHQGYQGFLGVDFLLEDNTNNVYLIECNPRLTANISLNSQIEIPQGSKPLIQYHLEAFSPQIKFKKIRSADKAQLGSFFVLRNNTDLPVQLKHSPESGKYQLLNSGKIKFLSAQLNLAACKKDEFIVHTEGQKSIISPNVKVATITAPFSVLDENGKVRSFVQNIFAQFVFKTIYIHPVDFWLKTYGKPRKSAVDLYQKPLKNFAQLSDQAKNRNRQSQLLKEEGSVTLLGEYEDFYLVKKWENTFGWAWKKDLQPASGCPKLTLSREKDHIKTIPADVAAQKFFGKFQKTPYLWGGLSPQGIDCSGLVQRYFLELFNFGLPKHSTDQIKYGKEVKSATNLQNHDLVFLHNKKKNLPHVGIFYQNKIWHACLSKNKVVSQSLKEISGEYLITALRRLSK